MTATVHRMLPLHEGKMGHQYNHRAATFVGAGDTDIEPLPDAPSDVVAMPRYWVREQVVEDRLHRRTWGTRNALLGFRRVARNTDERTIIASILPFGAASYGWILTAGPDARGLALLCAQYNSFVLDFVLRNFLSQPSVPQGTFEQLPVLPPASLQTCPWVDDLSQWLLDRVAALIGGAEEVADYVAELRGQSTDAAVDPARRAVLRAELDAAMFHLYGIDDRDDVDYILGTFSIVNRKDVAVHGEERTRRLVLERHDDIAEATRTGTTFASTLEPQPGTEPCDAER